jgi:hypothetical protein
MDSALSLLASVAVDELAEKRPPRSSRQQPVPKAHAAAAPAATGLNGVPAVLPATAAIATPPEQELAAMVSSLLAKQLHAMRSMVKQATAGPSSTTSSSSSEGPSVMVPVGCMLDLLDLVLRCSGLIAGGPGECPGCAGCQSSVCTVLTSSSHKRHADLLALAVLHVSFTVPCMVVLQQHKRL